MQLDSIASHRRCVGRYNAVPKKLTQKTIIKAIKKARNSQETLRTQRANSSSARNRSNTLMTVVKIALVASVVAATIPSVGAITNGISRNHNVNVKNTFPRIENHVHRDPPSKRNFCSSTRISANQVLTAAHCIMEKESTTSARHTATVRTNAKTRTQRGDADLSLMTFHRTLTGSTFCVPIMTNETYEMLLRSPANICGLTGRLLMVGHGASEARGTARAGVFEPVAPHPSFRRFAHKSTVMVGAPFNANAPNAYPYAGQGDSGAGVLGCNPATGQYELVGVFAQFADLKYRNHPNVKAGVFVNLIEHQELSAWVTMHRETCTGSNISPEDIYDPSVRGLGERHQVDKCKLFHRYYQKVGMSHDEICNCFEQKGTIAPKEFKCTDEPTTIAPTTAPPTTASSTTAPPTTTAPIQPIQNDFILPDCLDDLIVPVNKKKTLHYVSSECSDPMSFQIKPYCKTSNIDQADITIPARGKNAYLRIYTKSEELEPECKNPFTDGTVRLLHDFTLPDCLPDYPYPANEDGITEHYILGKCDVPTTLLIKSYCRAPNSKQTELIVPSAGVDSVVHFTTVSEESNAECKNPFTDGRFKDEVKPTTKPLIPPKKPITVEVEDVADCIDVQLTENNGFTKVDLQNTCDHNVGIAMTFGNQEITKMISLQSGQNDSISMSIPLDKDSVHVSMDGKKYKSVPKFFENRVRKDEPSLTTAKPTTKPLIILPKNAADYDVDCIRAQLTENRGQITVDLQNTCDHNVGVAMTFGNREVTNILSLQSGQNSSISMHMPLNKDSVSIAEDGRKYTLVPKFFENRGIK